MIGNTISHYRIVEKPSQAGTREVSLAQDTSLDRKVTIKILPNTFLREVLFQIPAQGKPQKVMHSPGRQDLATSGGHLKRAQTGRAAFCQRRGAWKPGNGASSWLRWEC